MKLPKNVKVKAFPWTVFPLLSKYTAHAIYPNVYIPHHMYTNLAGPNPNPEYVSVLIHEQTHIKRQKAMGWFIWGFRYCTSSKFRFTEELAAITTSMEYLKKKGIAWNTARSAHFLSSYLYLWCTDYQTAKKKLDDAWNLISSR